MKLKTLNDLKKHVRGDYIRKVKHPYSKGPLVHIVKFKELKAEAVKWVKHFKSNIKETDDFNLKTVNHGSVVVLMDFFNLTEEDLK